MILQIGNVDESLINRLRTLINKIFQSHDNKLNKKYNVELNKKTIERVKNSF